jgi:hypothetical protein
MKKSPHDFIATAVQISAGVRPARSIDRYIDRFYDDKRIGLIGKAAIVFLLLRAEQKSYLAGNRVEELGWDDIDKTWYRSFSDLAFDGIRKPKLQNTFENVTVISFNYDRCLQQFLTLDIARAYHISPTEAYEIVKTLKIIWPYGCLGDYAATPHVKGIQYGGVQHQKHCFELGSNLHTFTEQMQSEELKQQIADAVTKAKTIVFLGFGFHPQNVELLTPHDTGRKAIEKILATSRESEANRGAITETLRRLFTQGRKRDVSVTVPQTDCSGLFKDYSRLMV